MRPDMRRRHPWPGTPFRRGPASPRKRRPRRRRGTQLLWIRPVDAPKPEDPRMYYALDVLMRIVDLVAAELERLALADAGEDTGAGDNKEYL